MDETQSKKRMLKVVAVADTHAPEQDVMALNCACNYISYYQPDKIIHLGDAGDFKSVSHWIQNKRLLTEGLRVNDDIKNAVDVLNVIKSAAPSAELVLTMGNHDDWCNKYIEEHSEIEGLLDIEEEYKRAGWQVIKINKPYQVGKLVFGHGWFVGKYHANSTIHAFSKSVIYGHTHTFQAHTESFLDGEKMAMSIGCLCDMNPHYLRNRPNRWVHGFATIDIDIATGEFFIDFIKIIKGRFSRNGIIYKG